MKDNPDEIADVMNLILPLDQQFDAINFNEKYLIQSGPNTYTVKPDKIKDLKSKFKGRISFLKEMNSSVKKVFEGEKNIGTLQQFVVDVDNMSKFQTKYYGKALEQDEGGKKGVYTESRQASLFVFPDGTYGTPMIGSGDDKKIDENKGFGKYLTRTASRKKVTDVEGKEVKKQSYKYELSPELKKLLKGENDEDTLNRISKYSSKYSAVIKSILKAKNQSIFVYCELVSGSGAILFSQLLTLFNFSAATGKESTDNVGLRFAVFSSETASPKEIMNIKDRFNKPDNKYGGIIKVLIGSRLVSEGFSFMNIQQEFILTPWWNYSETSQAIARGYRLNSHKDLIEAGENPILYVTQCVSIPFNNKYKSIDLVMYQDSEDKDISIKGIMRILMESSFDCALNYDRNHVTGFDGQRDCDYTDCDYVCDGINMKNIVDKLPIEELDYSTYQIYYSDPKVSGIRKKIEKMFRDHNNMDMDSIIKNLEKSYTEWEVKNAIKIIANKQSENLIYSDYLSIYSRSNVKKIIIGIEVLFRDSFSLNLDIIVDNFSSFTLFEIITALRNIINENLVVKNKYGFPSYLREDNNIYFLVDSLSVIGNSFSSYYTQKPNITNIDTFMDIFRLIQIKLLPNVIKAICKLDNEKDFFKLIKAIPEDVQEMFIESSILAHEKNIQIGVFTRNLIMSYFETYIRKIDNVWISTRLKEQDNILKCLTDGKWDKCDKKYEDLLVEEDKKIRTSLEENPYGIYGKYNPENNKFCIVNIKEQLKKQKDELVKFVAELEKQKLTNKEKNDQIEEYKKDYRNIFPGRVCDPSWNVPELLDICVNVLKLPDDGSLDKYKENKLREMLNKLSSAKKKKLTSISAEKIDGYNTTELRRLLYWINFKKSSMCEVIREFFSKTTYKGTSLLIPDHKCGTKGGHSKGVEKKIETKQIPFRIDRFIPKNKPEQFKEYIGEIRRLMNECFKNKKYNPPISDNREWAMIFSRKKYIGFVIFGKNNIIEEICIGSNYRRRKDIAKAAVQTAVNNICPDTKPIVKLDNRNDSYTKLIKMYESIGFTIITNDGSITTMEFECEQ